MKYNFKKHDWDGTTVFGIESESSPIRNIGSWGWTSAKAQEIINKVESNRSLEKIKDPYVWGNEDVTVFANELGVLLVDKLAMRAKQEVEPLELTHDEFIAFMKDFKKFIEENN